MAFDLSHTYDFSTGAQGWTWTPAGAGIAVVSNAIYDDGTLTGARTFTSPMLSAGAGATGLSVAFDTRAGSPALSSATVAVTFGGVAHTPVSLTCTASPAHCSATITGGGSVPATGQSYTLAISYPAQGQQNIDNVAAVEVGATPPCVGNCINYPVVDLPTVSTRMGSFFAYLSPLLYVLGGIGLGGLIIAKARHLF